LGPHEKTISTQTKTVNPTILTKQQTIIQTLEKEGEKTRGEEYRKEGK